MEVAPWLALGLAAALGDSVGDVVTKRYFAHLPPYGMALARLLGAIPFLALAALWLTLPPLASAFWLIVAACCPWRPRPCSCTCGPSGSATSPCASPSWLSPRFSLS